MIAKELRLSRDEVDRLHWAALLHDVGKLEVPTEILNNPGRPSDEEWQYIRSHPELGARLAEPLRAWLGEWTDAISDHHERWDGKGYPHGSEGDGISLAGRIVAVADVFDVITSARSYKEPGSAGAARDEIARCAGAQFDPRVVRAFLSISLGRLRLAMGPLSWLAQAPVLGRIPLTPGLATVASSAVAVIGSVAAGLAGTGGPPATLAASGGSAAVAAPRAAPAAPRAVPAALAPPAHGGLARLVVAGSAPALAAPAAAAEPLPAARAVPVAPDAPADPRRPELPADSDPPARDPIAPASDPRSPPVVVPRVVPPSFTAGPGVSVAEDAGAQALAGWATEIHGAGVAFAVSDDNQALFAAGRRPAVAPDGTLGFTTATDASGSAQVTVRAVAADGQLSAPATVTIAVTPVNDAPSFSAGGDQTVFENAAAQSVPGWATAIVRGPADEAGQTVSFAVTASDTTLFTVGGQPAVAADGALTYTPAAGAHGTATIMVRAVDGGGTAAGGADTSAPQSFAITLVNRAPTATADAPGVLENAVAGVTFNVLVNDTDPESDALSIASHDDTGIANGGLTDNGGGNFTYVPAPHFSGTDTFTYTVSDGNGNTATAVVTITITAVPDPPAAASDAYVTPQGTALVQAAPGVLANDADSGAGALTATPVAGPANGSLSLAADGSFTYTPGLGFTGTDTFTYRATSAATGLTSDAVATITVSATYSSSRLYLGSSGPTSELWNLTTAAPGWSLLVPDYDGDFFSGLTLKSSNGADTGNAQRSQTWRSQLASPLVLQGPVTLHLSSSGTGSNTAYVYLYDCTAGGAVCTQIAFNSLTSHDWLGLGLWAEHEISVGTVNRTLPAGHELRLRLYSGIGDQWVAMTQSLPSYLTLTVP